MHIVCTTHAPSPCRSRRLPQGRLRHDFGSRRSKREGRAPSLQVDRRLIIVTPKVVATDVRFLCRGWHRRCFQLSGMAIAVAGSFRFRAARTWGSPHRPSIGVRRRSKPGPPGLNSARSRSSSAAPRRAARRGRGRRPRAGARPRRRSRAPWRRRRAGSRGRSRGIRARLPGRGAPPARARRRRGSRQRLRARGQPDERVLADFGRAGGQHGGAPGSR